MIEPAITTLVAPEYLTVPQAAQIMGVSPQLVYFLCQEKIIPSIKVGRLVRIPKKEFYEWLKGQNRAAQYKE
jgi:excisionase family DNA binding protein